MRSRTRDNLESLGLWRKTPPKFVAIFLLAVFFLFASFGFVFDGMVMGRQSGLHFALSVVLIGLFAVIYAVTGITLRKRWWIGCLVVFILQNVCMGLLANWLPDAPPFTQLNSVQLSHFHSRLAFDGVAVIVSVVLGYIGFIVVSIAEARRRIRLENEKAAIESELAAAREIQCIMVPQELPPTPGYAIESIYRPAAQVGGDFFQVIPLSGSQTLVVIGDVSGKGLGAAMIVSMLIGMLRTLSGLTTDPSQILAELNSMLFAHKHSGFVTCLAVRLDPSGSVTVANAGHLPPWLNGAELACAGSLPLGILALAAPEKIALEMRYGDRLTLLTDGIVEARNSQGVLFGFDRTQSSMREASPLALAEAAIHHGQDDDLTVIAIHRTS
ncbi:MAG: PP2C family protein-serine/threonine phosphatase [Terracidiphilus sp.]